MARSRNMQKLTEQLRARYPGVVIYGIGDDAHKASRSGHNEDDTPGSRPEDEDGDNLPEHRALDVMLGPAFSRADGHALTTVLTTHPENRRRLLYVIFDGYITSRSNGWVRRPHSGDPHRDHPHISGEADDDDNTAPWILDTTPLEDDVTVEELYSIIRAVQGGKTYWGFQHATAPEWAKDTAAYNNQAVEARLSAKLDGLAAAEQTRDAALKAVVDALAASVAAGGGSFDTAAVISAVHDVAGQVGTLTEALSAERAKAARLEQALADAYAAAAQG